MKDVKKYVEKMAINIAQKSVGRSIPVLLHEVKKPDNLQKMLDEVKKENNMEL